MVATVSLAVATVSRYSKEESGDGFWRIMVGRNRVPTDGASESI